MGPRNWIGNTNLREIVQCFYGTSVSLPPRLESGKTCKAVGDGIVKMSRLGYHDFDMLLGHLFRRVHNGSIFACQYYSSKASSFNSVPSLAIVSHYVAQRL